MNTALVILHADPRRGGAERYTLDLAEKLLARGHRVDLLASSFAPALPPGAGAVSLPAGGWFRTARYNRFLDSLDAHLAGHRYDIVHAMLPVRQCDVYHPHAGIAAEAVSRGHEKYPPGLWRGLARMANQANRRRCRFAQVERHLLTSSSPPLVLCLSRYIQEALLRHYTLPPDRLAILFNGVDLNRFDPAADPSAGLRLRERYHIPAGAVVGLMIAHDFERKGLRETLAALARINEPELWLVVVGKPDIRPYRRLAESGGIADRVVFAGPADDPRPFYQAADFFVLPTRHDPCSLVVLEALAMGLPVVSSRQNGACEAMQDGVEGYVLPDPLDTGALAATLRSMLDPDVRQRMNEACLALRPRLSVDAHIDQLEAIYARVARSTQA